MNDNEKITMGEPPPPRDYSFLREIGKGRHRGAFRQAADNNPGVWVSQPCRNSGLTSYYKKQGYEAETRSAPDGTRRIYIRKPIEPPAET